MAGEIGQGGITRDREMSRIPERHGCCEGNRPGLIRKHVVEG